MNCLTVVTIGINSIIVGPAVVTKDATLNSVVVGISDRLIKKIV